MNKRGFVVKWLIILILAIIVIYFVAGIVGGAFNKAGGISEYLDELSISAKEKITNSFYVKVAGSPSKYDLLYVWARDYGIDANTGKADKKALMHYRTDFDKYTAFMVKHDNIKVFLDSAYIPRTYIIFVVDNSIDTTKQQEVIDFFSREKLDLRVAYCASVLEQVDIGGVMTDGIKCSDFGDTGSISLSKKSGSSFYWDTVSSAASLASKTFQEKRAIVLLGTAQTLNGDKSSALESLEGAQESGVDVFLIQTNNCKNEATKNIESYTNSESEKIFESSVIDACSTDFSKGLPSWYEQVFKNMARMEIDFSEPKISPGQHSLLVRVMRNANTYGEGTTTRTR